MVFLPSCMYFVAFWILAQSPRTAWRFGWRATIAPGLLANFMAGIGFDVTAHGGIAPLSVRRWWYAGLLPPH